MFAVVYCFISAPPIFSPFLHEYVLTHANSNALLSLTVLRRFFFNLFGTSSTSDNSGKDGKDGKSGSSRRLKGRGRKLQSSSCGKDGKSGKGDSSSSSSDDDCSRSGSDVDVSRARQFQVEQANICTQRLAQPTASCFDGIQNQNEFGT